MQFRPAFEDFVVIGHYLGRITIAVGVVMAAPLLVAVLRGNVNDASALAIGTAIALGFGHLLKVTLRPRRELDWSHGLVTVALAWATATVITAVPLYLSGHFGSFLDACFDAMSGYTTSGLSLLQDLDHLSVSMNLLRHVTHLAGGQGIVVAMLTVMSSAGAQISTLYVGEGRDDRIVPSVVRTARFIWTVVAAWAVVGVAALWGTGLLAGLRPLRAVFHAVAVFIAAFDTGGFAPYSTSMAYYHSGAMELVVLVLMVAGGLSFGLHFMLWQGRWRDATRNLEVRSLAVTMAGTIALVVFGLARAGTFDTTTALWRKGVLTLVSAHTGTGFAFNAAALYTSDWGLIAPGGVVVAMALGAMGSSTAGGIKAVRVGLATKSVVREIRRAVMPDSAVVGASWFGSSRQQLTDQAVRSAVTIVVLYLVTYLGGAAVGVFYGFDLTVAMFESVSAAANVGLTSGLLGPDNPIPLKLVYLVQMWLGRMEFVAVFAMVGWLWALVRARV
jgi:trk system potassium uptake protein TrkH